jgi:hypothetical protein
MAAVRIALIAMVLVLLGACANYNTSAYRKDAAAQVVDAQNGYTLQFVEADDEGWLYQPGQATKAIDAVRDSVKEKDTFVVLFVHGWHHSAQCCDDNVEGFKETLTRLHQELARPGFRQARDGAEDFRLIGIYVSWRARSLPSWLDYFSFWGRKSAAERIAEVDVREFLNRLNRVYRDQNRPTEARAADNGPAGASSSAARNFLGLVTIGHSFGGQLVLRTVSASLEQELEELNPAPGYLHERWTIGPPSQPTPAPRAVRGFGDLVILVNPAVEAAAYQKLNVLSRGMTYPQVQTPVMLTVSADNDKPRHGLFTWGRILGEWFTSKPYKPDLTERESERQALGVWGPNGVQVTHRLQPIDAQMSLIATQKKHTPEPLCPSNVPCECTWYEWRSAPTRTEPDSLSWSAGASLTDKLSNYDFSARTVFDNVVLEPQQGSQPYQPFIVTSATPNLIDGHSGIFSGPFIDFLMHYIGFVEGKEYLLASEGRGSKHTAAPRRGAAQ